MRRKKEQPPSHLFQPDRLPQPVQPRGTLFLLVLFAAVVVGIVLLLRMAATPAGTVREAPGSVQTPTPERLEQAVHAVENAAAAVDAPGWPADRLARRLAATLNARRGPIGFVVGAPTAPWQVALVPVEEERLIRVEGYADDLSLPTYITEIPLR